MLQNNQWYHIVAVFKQNKYFNISINGMLDASATPMNKPVGTSSETLYIGILGWMGSGNAYYDGLIDEVRISDGKTKITVDSGICMHGKRSWNVTEPSTRIQIT